MSKKILSICLALIAAVGLAGLIIVPYTFRALGRPGSAALEPALTPPQAGVEPEDRSAAGLPEATPLVPVCKIQGSGFASPHAGQQVRTQGVVYADFETEGQKGFFIQEPGCDSNAATSNGIFIYLGSAQDVVGSGDRVEVAGLVQEEFGLTQLLSSPDSVTILSSGQPLPTAEELFPPFDDGAAMLYFESVEGMYVSLVDGTVVGPTSSFDETWLVRTDLGIGRVFQDDPAGTGEVITVDGEGPERIEPPASVGDRVTGLAGVMGYGLASYRLHLLQAPSVVESADGMPDGSDRRLFPQTELSLPALLTFEAATFNVENLFDTIDDPATEDTVLSAAAYQRHLEKLEWAIMEAMGAPEVIGLQEVENETVLNDLISRPELAGLYDFLHLEGIDARGIDVAVLYRSDRTQLLSYEQRQGCTALIDGLGPDGNLDVQNPQNGLTCDSNGDGILDGNRLFSRPPLLLQIKVCSAWCLGLPGMPTPLSVNLWVIVAHLKSKTQDTEWNQYTLPRRMEESSFIASLIGEIVEVHPGAQVMVLGDLNDYPDSAPLGVLYGAGMQGMTSLLEPGDRYTYIYQGVSQVLDHVLVNGAMLDEHLDPRVIHVNVDFPEVLGEVDNSPYRSSDHDPLIVKFTVLPYKFFLPLGSRAGADADPDWRE
ncbi:MAG TPA: endonuclease/exonuclease/phosphatase family protein [Anaerolineales bacterium]|nr:endonuclease/exonuclease/phosphatase family protein [Anaerolineales bacterium]